MDVSAELSVAHASCHVTRKTTWPFYFNTLYMLQRLKLVKTLYKYVLCDEYNENLSFSLIPKLFLFLPILG